MNRRIFVEFITAIILICIGVVTLILPILSIIDVKNVFLIIISLYGIINLIKNIAIINSKDYTSFFVFLSCIVVLILSLFMDISDSPWNLALILFIWIILMSLIKLKESDYYHDLKNKLWEINIINLILFILIGILCTINLYCTTDIQILVLGFFFLINGILELMNPIVTYLIEKK